MPPSTAPEAQGAIQAIRRMHERGVNELTSWKERFNFWAVQ